MRDFMIGDKGYLKGAPSSSPFPFYGIASCVQDCNHDDRIALDGEVDSVGENGVAALAGFPI
jgi:hypothetical protein